MAWIRRRNGQWAATVRLPRGSQPDRVTRSFELKGQADEWAAGLEADVRRGDWIDPRAGDLTVGQWWDRCKDARHLELASRRRDASHWRVHVAPRWQHTPVGAILRPDVSAWVTAMQRAGVGAATIQGAVGVLRGLMDQAVDARLRRDNPAKGVRLPRRNAHVDRVLLPDEDELLLASLERQFPDRPDARLFVEVLLYCGLRWEEAAAVDRDHVDLRRGIIHVGPVLERDGTVRPYPKSPAGVRDVPVPEHLWPQLRAHAMTVHPERGPEHPARRRPAVLDTDGSTPGVPPVRVGSGPGLLFTKPGGGPLDYPHWLSGVWRNGLHEVIQPGRRGRVAVRRTVLDDPQPTPHDLRHTFLTRLGDAGLGVHEIMALAGHATLASAQRYLHAGEDRFDRARAAMKKARGL